jgi:hypothetical protein
MTTTIGPKGYEDLFAADVGPDRKVTIVAFTGLAAAGPIVHPHFPPTASKRGVKLVLDMVTGLNSTSYFSDTGSVAGNLHLTQTDTGQGGNFSGHTMWAIISDTGT